MTKGFVHSVESFGSVDGPGIRFLIFLQGCPMRCQFCHNPDSWKTGIGEERTADELLDQAERFRAYWGDNGGITVSGGEALLQIDFLLELFEKAKQRGIGTCLDTSAQLFTRKATLFEPLARSIVIANPGCRFIKHIYHLEHLRELTDTVLLDIKHIDDEEHRKLTRHSNANILDCARYLSEIDKPVWIRHVLIPGITDKDEYLVRLRDFLSTLHNIERIEVLPYHTLGVYKYEKLGIDYPLKDVQPPAAERVANANDILQQAL